MRSCGVVGEAVLFLVVMTFVWGNRLASGLVHHHHHHQHARLHQRMRLAFGGVSGVLPTARSVSVWSPSWFGKGSKLSTSSQRSASASTNKDEGSSSSSSFPTWTFERPCASMEFTNVPNVSISVLYEEAVASETSVNSMEVSDLILVGVAAPPGSDCDSDSDEKEDSKEKVPVVLEGLAASWDEKLGGALTDLLKESQKEFQNGAVLGGTTPTVRLLVPQSDGSTKMKRFALIGLGKSKEESSDVSLVTKLGGSIVSKCTEESTLESCTVLLPLSSETSSSQQLQSQMQLLTCQLYSGLYADNRYRTGKNVKVPAEHLKELKLIVSSTPTSTADSTVDVDSTVDSVDVDGKQLAYGVYMTKDIVNAPHNVLNSESLAETARRIAAESTDGCLTCTVLDRAECERRGMGAFLGVARGSETEPQFIHLTYRPPHISEGTTLKRVGIIGKGLLFDTGGYNIKTQMMELMKFDCGGAAAVLGAARAVSRLQPPNVEAHFVVAACENMINDRAVVPSDILTASNGKTIEVVNTDAEGRLTLADALVYCDVGELHCDKIIELSTLTGACMVALGKDLAGVWTAHDGLAAELAQASRTTEEKTWRMPLEAAYNDQLESKLADLTNCGTRYGGAITAALFLQNFVKDTQQTPFAHIDIAGPVWNDKTGATGYGMKLVTEWVRMQSKL